MNAIKCQKKQYLLRLCIKGHGLPVKKDVVELDNGRSYSRDVVEHGPAVVVLPINQDGKLLLIRQFRYAIKDYLLEAPAGAIDIDEAPLDAAKRELQEETGYVAKDWLYCGGMYLAPGFCNEFMHFFCAKRFNIYRNLFGRR